jgi:glycine cleavage system H protein
MTSINTPDDRKYTKTHEWIKIQGEKAIVGITHHAQESLGDITFVELPALGKKVKKEESCCVIESVKAASDIYSPISGEILEVNNSLETSPEIINKDPYNEGWIFALRNFDSSELAGLMSALEYNTFLETEK